MIAFKLDERAKNFQKSIDVEELKRRRDEDGIELRKQKRADFIAKKRALAGKVACAAELMEETDDFPFNLVDPVLAETEPKLVDPVLSPIEKLDLLLSLFMNTDRCSIVPVLKTLKSLLSSEGNPPVVYIAKKGVIPKLVTLLGDEDETVVLEAVWSLTNLCTGSIDLLLVAQGCLPALKRLVVHPNPEISDSAIWTLSNIAGDCEELKNAVIDLEVADLILTALEKRETRAPKHVESMVWFLANITREPATSSVPVIAQSMSVVPWAICSEMEDIVSDACWILCYVTDGGDRERIEKVLEIDVAQKLLNLILAPTDKVQIPALRAIGNMTTGDDSQIQTLLNLGLLDKLFILLTSRKKLIRKDAIWCLSNVTAGSLIQVKQVVDHPAFSSLIRLMNELDFSLRKEAVWAVVNALAMLERKDVGLIAEMGVLPPLIETLDYQDAGALFIALDGISILLKSGEVPDTGKGTEHNQIAQKFESLRGVEALEALQGHPNLVVYTRVVSLMDEFFGVEEVSANENRDEENRVPAGGFDFS